MLETDSYQGWCILKDDKTLQRAIERQTRKEVEYYQIHQLSSAIKKVKQRGVAVDVGAHYGVMSYNLSKLFKEIHAFEVDPDVFHCLQQNVKRFNLNSVTAYPYGLGDKTAKVGLHKKQSKTFSTHVDLDSESTISEIRTLDSFGIKNVDLIKIDVEGFEPAVIQGALNTIEKYKPVILYECKGHEMRYGYARDSVLEMLSPLGYKELHLWDLKNKLIGVV